MEIFPKLKIIHGVVLFTSIRAFTASPQKTTTFKSRVQVLIVILR